MNKIDLISTILILTMAIFSCNSSKDKVPDIKDVLNENPEFYFQALNFHGDYIDYDSGAIIFSYDLDGEGHLKWLKKIEESANTNRWETFEKLNTNLNKGFVFRRIDEPKLRYVDSHSLEIFRVVLCEKSVLFGGIQFDVKNGDKIDDVFTRGTHFSREKFWPLFDRFVEEKCTTDQEKILGFQL
ncbi:MAG: hypothetical protein OQL09_01570 [Gammaproteobacteria bacterium]|nr:hypothetical protein [Gammaproteobacteria bacterium]